MNALERVNEYWGDAAPDWVLQLAIECDNSSQRDVAVKIGYSPAAVTQILKNAYKANLRTVEVAVRGAFMN
ncbi:MAG: helix-turn-helix transcriptional regulator, partial [Kangiella sp.]|nr:helix-turn-helix transcriptional regulator [Kangiella sp.]